MIIFVGFEQISTLVKPFFEILTGKGCRNSSNFLGSSRCKNSPSRIASLGSEVDDMVGTFDDVEIVFDDQNRVSRIADSLQHLKQLGNVLGVESCRGLVENIDRPSRASLCKLGCKLDSLRFASGKSRGGLTDLDIAESDVIERLELARDGRNAVKEGKPLLYRHIQHLENILSFIMNVKCIAVVTLALAHVTRHVNVGQEVHFNTFHAVALARLAASALDVEGNRPAAKPFAFASFVWANKSRRSPNNPV